VYPKIFASLAAICCSLVLLSACSKKSTAPAAASSEPTFAVTCIAVLPVTTFVQFDKTLPAAEKEQLDDGVLTFDRVLQKYFISRKDVRLVSDGQISGMDNNLPAQPLARARVIADKLSCNAVLETTLRRYRDRVGGQYSAADPASVAFSYRLLGMPGGQVLCRGTFDETQQSVMENLLSLSAARERGFSWITSEQLMKEGVRDRFSECGYLTAPE
jgi:hypothetical protein